jgi:hypothetical protein
VGRSLTRGQACSFQLLLGITSAVFLGSDPTGLMSIFYCLFLRLRDRILLEEQTLVLPVVEQTDIQMLA